MSSFPPWHVLALFGLALVVIFAVVYGATAGIIRLIAWNKAREAARRMPVLAAEEFDPRKIKRPERPPRFEERAPPTYGEQTRIDLGSKLRRDVTMLRLADQGIDPKDAVTSRSKIAPKLYKDSTVKTILSADAKANVAITTVDCDGVCAWLRDQGMDAAPIQRVGVVIAVVLLTRLVDIAKLPSVERIDETPLDPATLKAKAAR